MAQLNFPPFTDSDPDPTNGEIWTAPNGTQWEYDISIPAWKALANPGPGVKYRGGIDLTADPNSQYTVIQSGNLFGVTTGADPASNSLYPGIGGITVEVGAEIIYDGTEWQFLSVQIPYASKSVAGKVELATIAEAQEGIDDKKALTPKTGRASVPDATTTTRGRVELATRTEAERAIDTEKALTPDSISNILALINANTVNQVPTGMIMWCPDTSPPDGWMVCDNSRVYNEGITQKLYKYLKAVSGKPYSDGDIVRVPDLRGRFIRGNNQGNGLDPADTSIGSAQGDLYKEHKHNIDDPGHKHNIEGHELAENQVRSAEVIVDERRSASQTLVKTAINNSSTGITIKESGGSETRPKNLNLLPCIKL